jgi:crotonobetainyl-CoA:carnitine CoA-transferase CaiB-like acyl-CoA transferase
VPAMPYHTLDTLMDDPHLKEVRLFETVDHPTEGPIVNLTLPNKLSRGARRDFIPAPKLGQHSVEILQELGFTADAIDAMVAEKVTADGRIDR